MVAQHDERWKRALIDLRHVFKSQAVGACVRESVPYKRYNQHFPACLTGNGVSGLDAFSKSFETCRHDSQEGNAPELTLALTRTAHEEAQDYNPRWQALGLPCRRSMLFRNTDNECARWVSLGNVACSRVSSFRTYSTLRPAGCPILAM